MKIKYKGALKINEEQRILIEKGLPLLREAAELDPDQVQSALEDAVGETAVLEDFLSQDNMKRFEAAAEFLPKLKDFFGALNTHFEVQKAQQEEAEAQAEEEAAAAEAEAEAKAEEEAAAAEEEPAEDDEMDQAAEEVPPTEPEPEPEPEVEEVPEEEPAEAPEEEEVEAPEEPEEALQESFKRMKSLAGLNG